MKENTPHGLMLVLKRCRILPVHLELAVRRLRWVKCMVTKPSTVGALLLAWFAKYEFDNTTVQELPWNIQLVNDLTLANRIEDWTDITLQVKSDPTLLFTTYRDNMSFFDHKHLRAVLLDKLDCVFAKANVIDAEVPGHIHICDIPDELGNCCGYQALTLAKLRHHQVFSRKTGHSARNIINVLTVTNQCCVCMSVFADKNNCSTSSYQCHLLEDL